MSARARERGSNQNQQHFQKLPIAASSKHPKKHHETTVAVAVAVSTTTKEKLAVLRNALIAKIETKGDVLIKHDLLDSLAVAVVKDAKSNAGTCTHTDVCDALYNELPTAWTVTGKARQRKITRVIAITHHDGHQPIADMHASTVDHQREIAAQVRKLNEPTVSVSHLRGLDHRITTLLMQVVMENAMQVVTIGTTGPAEKAGIIKQEKKFVSQVTQVFHDPDLAHLRKNICDAFKIQDLPKDWLHCGGSVKWKTNPRFPNKDGVETLRDMMKDITCETLVGTKEPVYSNGTKDMIDFTLTGGKGHCRVIFKLTPALNVFKLISGEIQRAQGCPVDVGANNKFIEIKKPCTPDIVWEVAQICHSHLPNSFLNLSLYQKKSDFQPQRHQSQSQTQPQTQPQSQSQSQHSQSETVAPKKSLGPRHPKQKDKDTHKTLHHQKPKPPSRNAKNRDNF
eukprot:m.54662 g.54662  ORF g.54662 m.54662 type:complete len:453 (-) comp21954_c0_seq1:77-1435(-)